MLEKVSSGNIFKKYFSKCYQESPRLSQDPFRDENT